QGEAPDATHRAGRREEGVRAGGSAHRDPGRAGAPRRAVGLRWQADRDLLRWRGQGRRRGALRRVPRHPRRRRLRLDHRPELVPASARLGARFPVQRDEDLWGRAEVAEYPERAERGRTLRATGAGEIDGASRDASMLAILGLVVGLVLLVFGRRLYWLLVAGIGFLTGLELAPRLLPDRPEWMILVAALGLALVGTVLAIVAQKLIIGLVGFLAGGGTGVLLLHTLEIDGDVLPWLVYVVGGILGIVLVLILFEWGLILLSSLAGAALIVGGIVASVQFSHHLAFVAMIVVAVIGVIVQASWLGAPPRRRRPERGA